MRTVRDIARDLGISSDEVLDRLRRLGTPAAGDLSLVDPRVAARLRTATATLSAAGERAAVRKAPPPPPPPSDAALRAASAALGGRRADGRAADRTRVPPPPPPPPAAPAPPSADEGEATAMARIVDDDLSPWRDAEVVHRSTPRPVVRAPARARPARASARGRWASQLAELPLLVLLAFGIAVVIKTFLVQAFFIPSGSMLPTLRIGDRVLVEKLSYRLRDPERQDVVVFAQDVFGGEPPELPWYEDARDFMRELLGLPTGGEQDYIKRVVAVEDDVIRYAGKPRRLEVNGSLMREPYVGPRDRFSPTLTGGDCRRLDMEAVDGGCRVPEGTVFVMGDNRGNSEDSRAIGPIPEDKVVGHAFVVLWPPSDFGGL
jgi:signal peptidase I